MARRSTENWLIRAMAKVIVELFRGLADLFRNWKPTTEIESKPGKSLSQRFKEEEAEVSRAMAEGRYVGLYWLSTTLTRHNPSCRYFNNCTGFATRQRAGNPCDKCGG